MIQSRGVRKVRRSAHGAEPLPPPGGSGGGAVLQDGPVPRLRTAKPKVGVAILRGGCCPRNTFNLVSPVPASVIESKPFHAFVSQPPRAQHALWGALLQTQTNVFARVSLCGARPVNPGSGGGGVFQVGTSVSGTASGAVSAGHAHAGAARAEHRGCRAMRRDGAQGKYLFCFVLLVLDVVVSS